MVRGRIVGRDYEPDRIWSKARTVHSIDVSNFGSQVTLDNYIRHIMRSKDKYMRNLGEEGRRQVIAMAIDEWSKVPLEVRLIPLLTMRERGMISASEFKQFAQEQGYTAGQAEYKYRQWTGTEASIWDLHQKDLLRYGELSKATRAKGLSRGQAYYRRKKYQAIKYGVPFRGFEKFHSKPRSKRKTLG